MFKALKVGLARGFGHPVMVLGLWLVLVLAALPAAWVVTASIEQGIGASRAAEPMTRGFDFGWHSEFKDAARGLDSTFGPSLTGAGAVLENLEDWATGGLFKLNPAALGLGAAFAAVWALLLGGVLTRFAHPDEARGPSRFLQAGAGLYFRFLRLVLFSSGLYYLIYRLHRFLYGKIGDWTAEVLEERTVLLVSLGVVALTVFLLTLVHVCFAYAKIATVLEGRRSMLFAALRGVGFVISHPVRTLGLYYAMGLIAVAALAIYALIAPGADQATATGILAAFLFGQAYLILRLCLRVSTLGAQMSLYESLGAAPKAAPEIVPDRA